MIGGVATTVCHKDEYVKVNQGKPGDKLMLTKPLGTQVAVNLNEWLLKGDPKWKLARNFMTEERARDAYYLAV